MRRSLLEQRTETVCSATPHPDVTVVQATAQYRHTWAPQHTTRYETNIQGNFTSSPFCDGRYPVVARCTTPARRTSRRHWTGRECYGDDGVQSDRLFEQSLQDLGHLYAQCNDVHASIVFLFHVILRLAAMLPESRHRHCKLVDVISQSVILHVSQSTREPRHPIPEV